MKLKHALIIAGIMALTGITVRCADKPPSAPQEPVVGIPVERVDPQKFFRANEFSVEGFAGLRTSDFDDERSHAGVGVSYYITENIGFGADTSWEDLNGHFFDNLSARALYRIPIDRNAIYGFLGGQFLFDPDDWAGILGVGVERRWTPRIGTFLEIGMFKELTGDERAAAATARVGVRYAF